MLGTLILTMSVLACSPSKLSTNTIEKVISPEAVQTFSSPPSVINIPALSLSAQTSSALNTGLFVSNLSVGDNHSCLLMDTGVYCWGSNESGQLNVPAGLKKPIAVTVGNDHTCVAAVDTLTCWGGIVPPHSNTNFSMNIKNLRFLSSDQNITCALDDEGLKCWQSKLNDKILLNSEDRFKKAQAIYNFGYYYLSPYSKWNDTVILEDGALKFLETNETIVKVPAQATLLRVKYSSFCWKNDTDMHCGRFVGRLAKDDAQSRILVEKDFHFTNLQSISVFDSYKGQGFCAVDDGIVRCWRSDQKGKEFKEISNSPLDLKNILMTEQSPLGKFCGLTKESFRCWTDDSLKDKVNEIRPIKNPRKIVGGAGDDHMCALDDNGVQCWGKNDHGQLGVPSELRNPVDIAVGLNHSCALTAESVVICWGDNSFNQSGTKVLLTNGKSIISQGNTNCAVSDEGVTCWGEKTNISPPHQYPMKPPCAIGVNGLVCETTIHGIKKGIQLVSPEKKPRDLIRKFHNLLCSYDDESYKCWVVYQVGAGEYFTEKFYGEITPINLPIDMKSPSSILYGETTSCAISNGSITCWQWVKGGYLPIDKYGKYIPPSFGNFIFSN